MAPKWRLLNGFLILFVIIILSGNKLYSDDVTFHFGLKGGYGFSDALVTEHSSSSLGFFNKKTFSGGMYFNFSHVDYARIQLEVMYFQKGFNRNNFTADLNYLSFPILVRFQFPFGLFLNLGFSITYLLNGTVSDSINPTSTIDDIFERSEFGLEAGLGWDIKIISGLKIFTEVRFTYTQNNISIRYPESINNYTLHLFLGIETDFKFSTPKNTVKK